MQVWLASDSATSPFSGVFEADAEGAFFYAYDRSNPGKPILDAVQVYGLQGSASHGDPSKATIIWSSDGLKAGLLVGDVLHAVIDFASRKSYCRSNSPPASGAWGGTQREPWQDSLAALLH
jgi:hypothetical protein